MPRTMYYSVDPAAIPADAEMVAGYIDGHYRWSAGDWARFPHAVQVGIAVFATTNHGHVLDVEPGDATPNEAPGWVRMRRASDVDPTVYCNLSTWPEVQAAFANAGVGQPHYWIADYDGIPELPTLNGITAVAKQYQNTADWDASYVADVWPGVDQGGLDMAELASIYQQHAGPNAVDGQYPGWPGYRYAPIDTADTTFTLLNYIREIDREVNSRIDLATRATPDQRPALDTLYGHVVSIRAELATLAAAVGTAEGELLAAIKAESTPSVDAQALIAAGLPEAIVTALLAVLHKSSSS